MRIRKLEMMGFKSFPERTVVQFGDGVSCIVGPNGCGKSNIIDALRWCIGEQSAKKLRGGEMMDVIFAGSKERKAVGYAEVSMTLSAEDGKPFPGEYSEYGQICVGRRLHRSGQSEYFVNQSNVRRRDVLDLFLDTGIGNNLYSFIEQGRIGEIVQARPEQRRGLLDEAAGIAKYKIRRDEAQKRLESTATQLDRAADVADEMGRRVRTLARQVLKAAEFRRVRALIRQNEVCLSLAKYANLAADRRALRETLRGHRNVLGRLERELARRKKELETNREELEVVEAGADTLRDELAEADATIREKLGEHGFVSRRLKELGERFDALTHSMQRAQEDQQALNQQVDEAKETLSQLGTQKLTLQGTKDEDKQRLRESEAAHATAQTQAALSERAVLAERARQEALEQQHAVQLERINALPALLSGAKERMQGIQSAIDENRRHTSAGAEALSAEQAAFDALEETRKTHQKTVQSLVDQGTQLQKQADLLRQKLSEKRRALHDDRQQCTQALQHAQEHEKYVLENQQKERRIWLKSVQAESRDRIRWARDEAQERFEAQSARLREWMEQLDRSSSNSREWMVNDQSMHRQAAEQQWKHQEWQIQSEQAAQLEVRLSSLQTEAQQRREALEHRITETQADWKQTREALAEIVETLRREEETLVGVQATLKAMTGAQAQGLMSEEVLQELLPVWRSMDEVITEAERDVATRVLNDRLTLPVVQSEETLKQLSTHAAEHGAVRVLWVPQSRLVYSEYQGRLLEASSFEEALSLHQKTGSSVVVLSTGDRIYADGLVELGHQGRAGRADLDLKQERARLSDAVESATSEVNRLNVERAKHVKKRTALESQLERLRHELAEENASMTHRLQETHRLAQVSLDDMLKAHETAAKEALANLAVSQRKTIEAWDSQNEVQRSRVKGQRRDILMMIQEDMTTQMDEVEARESKLLQQAEKEADQRSSELLREASRTVQELLVKVGRFEQEAEIAFRAMEQSVEDAQDALQSNHRALAAAAGELKQVESQAGLARRRMEALEAQGSGLEQQLEQLELRWAEAKSVVEALEGERLEAEGISVASPVSEQDHQDLRVLVQRCDKDQNAVEGLLADVTRLRDAVTAHKLLDVTLDERMAAQRAQIQTADQALVKAKKREQEIHVQQTELAQAKIQAAGRQRQLDDANEELKAERAKVWDKYQLERSRLSQLKKGLDASQQVIHEVEDKHKDALALVTEHEHQVVETQAGIEALRERMDDRYQVSLPGLLDRLEAQGKLEFKPPEATMGRVEVEGKVIEGVEPLIMRTSWLSDGERIQRMVAELEQNRDILGKIGEVNLTALEEYEDVRKRHTELETQRSDLEASIHRIRAAIAKMNRTCREQFRETFDLVNEAFQTFYPSLVGGGRARLSLTNEEDLLETGVDIFVQPPGKRLQNLNLLSGGEKAMAAIALIMALFKVKPSPFCVLDEVDAPLDEGNGSRFNAAIREMSRHSQFILVTHNRKTMECADTLLGITMPVPGVSRLVSVELEA